MPFSLRFSPSLSSLNLKLSNLADDFHTKARSENHSHVVSTFVPLNKAAVLVRSSMQSSLTEMKTNIDILFILCMTEVNRISQCDPYSVLIVLEYSQLLVCPILKRLFDITDATFRRVFERQAFSSSGIRLHIKCTTCLFHMGSYRSAV